MKQAMLVIGALAMVGVGASDALGADAKMHVCSLLTAAEVGAAVGGTMGQPTENDIVVSDGPSKGQTIGIVHVAHAQPGQCLRRLRARGAGRAARGRAGKDEGGLRSPQGPGLERGEEGLQQRPVRAR